MSHIYCPECGFQSPEAATYCSRCGALLGRETVDETTMSIDPGEIEAAAWRTTSKGRRWSSAPAAVERGRASKRSATGPSSGARPTATSSSTTSPSRVGMQSCSGRQGPHDPRPRQPQRHVRQQAADRVQRARGRRRASDRQIPDDVPATMTTSRKRARRPACTRSARSASACGTSSPISRSRKSATSRIRA